MNQSETSASNYRQARENACEHVMIGFGFIYLIGSESGVINFNQ